MTQETVHNHPVDIVAEELSENGWWKEECRDTFIKAYDQIIEAGISESDTIELLADLYSAVSGEFGC